MCVRVDGGVCQYTCFTFVKGYLKKPNFRQVREPAKWMPIKCMIFRAKETPFVFPSFTFSSIFQGSSTDVFMD